jgi:hypothetical protein
MPMNELPYDSRVTVWERLEGKKRYTGPYVESIGWDGTHTSKILRERDLYLENSIHQMGSAIAQMREEDAKSVEKAIIKTTSVNMVLETALIQICLNLCPDMRFHENDSKPDYSGAFIVKFRVRDRHSEETDRFTLALGLYDRHTNEWTFADVVGRGTNYANSLLGAGNKSGCCNILPHERYSRSNMVGWRELTYVSSYVDTVEEKQ